MENQGFEEEQRRTETPAESSRTPRHDPQTPSSDSARNQFFSTASLTGTDGHVYEDISPSVEAVAVPFGTDRSASEIDNPRRPTDVVDYVSREPGTKSSDRASVGDGLRRNLTLPFRRGTALDPSAANSSVRLTSRNGGGGGEAAPWGAGYAVDEAFSREIAARAQSTPLQTDGRSNRRRRKKDCKHCRNKAGPSSIGNAREYEIDDGEKVAGSWKNTADAHDSSTILDPSDYTGLPACSPMRNAYGITGNSSSVFTISEKIGRSPAGSRKTIGSGKENVADSMEGNVDSAAAEKSRASMRVNSIYSQDRWYAKEAPVFLTDVKEHSAFQRAYSLPARTQTPSSQNRINLRRSVRGEPPPHPARLRKHRHGWTLHLAHPLEASGCTRSLVILLIALLVLVGIGAAALYIALEPEKLQIIQQYLRSTSNESTASHSNALAAGTLLRRSNDERWNDSSLAEGNATLSSLENSTVASSSVVANDDRSSLEPGASPASETETVSVASLANSTRHCDDCLPEEVCVALVGEDVPTCRTPSDPQDPTGCAGFCLINKQKCHRLDVDAFRCVEVEHYCLDDEWTCLNTLCIPLEKHCDGHMNCYDHSDEYNCVCDPETHFQCGNETSCLPLEKRCDGKVDCWDAADEINCTLGRTLGGSCPLESEFTCSSGQCISRARFCDGLPDCHDGSDEPHGCQGRCNKYEFTCQNSRCVTKGMKCNGIDDCGDGTDERHCKERFS